MGGGGLILSIDPGEVHVGVALLRLTGGGLKITCDWAYEIKPPELIQMLEKEERTHIGQVLCEEFRLYPWKMAQQGFSQIKTVELIGVIRYLCEKRGFKLTEQPASIKEPTERILKAKGIMLKSYGQG